MVLSFAHPGIGITPGLIVGVRFRIGGAGRRVYSEPAVDFEHAEAVGFGMTAYVVVGQRFGGQ